jgi:hypothetical protein
MPSKPKTVASKVRALIHRKRWSKEALECIKLSVEIVGLVLIFATFTASAVLAVLQYKSNRIYKEQAAIAKDTEQRELRAYLHVNPTRMGVNITGITSHPTEVAFDVINDGQTPAHDVTVRSALVLAPYPATFTFDKSSDDRQTRKEYIAAHCSEQSSAKLRGQLSTEQTKQITKDTLRIYLVGDVQYSDIFNITRHLRFGFSLPGSAVESMIQVGIFPTGPISGQFEYEPSYNYEY